jgi:hypothetical protein
LATGKPVPSSPRAAQKVEDLRKMLGPLVERIVPRDVASFISEDDPPEE